MSTFVDQNIGTGWALIFISGSIPKEVAKLAMHLKNRRAAVLSPDVFALPCVKGQAGIDALADELRRLSTIETTTRVLFVSRLQWKRMHLMHGKPSKTKLKP